MRMMVFTTVIQPVFQRSGFVKTTICEEFACCKIVAVDDGIELMQVQHLLSVAEDFK
jgi:hypothetical protein